MHKQILPRSMHRACIRRFDIWRRVLVTSPFKTGWRCSAVQKGAGMLLFIITKGRG